MKKEILLIALFISLLIALTAGFLCNNPDPVPPSIDSTLYVNKHRLTELHREYIQFKLRKERELAALNVKIDSIKGLKDSVKIVYRDRTVYIDSFTEVQQDSFFVDRYGKPVTDSTTKNKVIKEVIRKDELEELSALDKAEIDHLEYIITEKDSIISYQDNANMQLSQLAEDNLAAAEALKKKLEKTDNKLVKAKTLNKILGVAVVVLGGVVFLLTQ